MTKKLSRIFKNLVDSYGIRRLLRLVENMPGGYSGVKWIGMTVGNPRKLFELMVVDNKQSTLTIAQRVAQ